MEVYEDIISALSEAIADAKSESKFLERHEYPYDAAQHHNQEAITFPAVNEAVSA